MTKHYDFPRGLLAISWALDADRLAALLVFVAIAIAACAMQDPGWGREDADRSAEAPTGGRMYGAYEIGAASFVEPFVFFDVIVETRGVVRVYQWRSQIGTGIPAEDALHEAIKLSSWDINHRQPREACFVLWRPTELSAWTDTLRLPGIQASKPLLVRSIP